MSFKVTELEILIKSIISGIENCILIKKYLT